MDTRQTAPASRLRPRNHPLLSTLLAALTVALFATTFTACGGAKPAPSSDAKANAAPATTAASAYDSHCAKLAAEYGKQVGAKTYLPTTLNVRGWTGAGATSGGTLSEQDYSALLNKGGPQISLLMARGGLGKSKLGWALQAQTCGKRATVRIDLHWDIAERMSEFKDGTNPLFGIIEKRLTGATSADSKLGIEKALNGRDLLLLLDSLDEVTLDERAKLVDMVQAVMAPIQGTGAVVFTRPPVFSANYDFARVDARLEIPMLDCDGTQRALRELVKEDAKLANFLEFTKKFGLDRMVVRDKGRCYYPHMATYRDIIVLRQIAASVAAAPANANSPLASRAKVYEFFLTAAIIKDLSGLKMMPKDLLAMVDEMVLAQSPDGSKRNFTFTVGACLSKARSGTAELNKQVCERLMQSTLFKETTSPDKWQFTNQSIGDLFLARWLNTAMKNKDGTTNCGLIGKQAKLFESNEVAGFIVGMASGKACLLPVAQELCNKGSDPDHNFELLDQGLPAGNERVELLKAAVDAAGDAVAPTTCLGGILTRLKKTVPADAFPTAEAKAPERPTKGKRSKKRGKKRRK